MYENLKDLAIIIAVAELFALLSRKIKLPQVVGQIIAGLLIGSRDVVGGANWSLTLKGEGEQAAKLVEKGKSVTKYKQEPKRNGLKAAQSLFKV